MPGELGQMPSSQRWWATHGASTDTSKPEPVPSHLAVMSGPYDRGMACCQGLQGLGRGSQGFAEGRWVAVRAPPQLPSGKSPGKGREEEGWQGCPSAIVRLWTVWRHVHLLGARPSCGPQGRTGWTYACPCGTEGTSVPRSVRSGTLQTRQGGQGWGRGCRSETRSELGVSLGL